MIELRNISANAGKKVILDNVSITFEVGRKYAITGESGSGKTSMLMAIAGILTSVKGEIWFRGEKVDHANIRRVREAIGFVSQEPDLGNGTVLDAIMLPFKFKANSDKSPKMEKIIDTLESLGLQEDILEKSSKIISGGEKQRIALARALLLEKTILILDEPTSALDPSSKTKLIDLLNSGNFTVLSVSHDPDWVAFCNESIKMESGRII